MTLWVGTVLSARRYPQPFYTERRRNALGYRTDRQLLVLDAQHYYSSLFDSNSLCRLPAIVLSGQVDCMPSKFELYLMSRSWSAREKRNSTLDRATRNLQNLCHAEKTILTLLAWTWTRRHIFAPKHRDDRSNSSVVAASRHFLSSKIFSFLTIKRTTPGGSI